MGKRRKYMSALDEELAMRERVENAIWHQQQAERSRWPKPPLVKERSVFGRRNARMKRNVTLPTYNLPPEVTE